MSQIHCGAVYQAQPAALDKANDKLLSRNQNRYTRGPQLFVQRHTLGLPIKIDDTIIRTKLIKQFDPFAAVLASRITQNHIIKTDLRKRPTHSTFCLRRDLLQWSGRGPYRMDDLRKWKTKRYRNRHRQRIDSKRRPV